MATRESKMMAARNGAAYTKLKIEFRLVPIWAFSNPAPPPSRNNARANVPGGPFIVAADVRRL